MSLLWCYTAVEGEVWVRLKRKLELNSRFSLMDNDNRTLVVRDIDDVLLADFGAYPEKNYYWISFLLCPDMYELIYTSTC